MARTYSAETNGTLGASTGPLALADASQLGAKTHKIIATITCASQASGDDIVLGKALKGMRFIGAEVTVSATLGSATLALGIVGSTAKYAAAATFTTADAPTRKAKATAIGVQETADALILATIGAAALPSSGTIVIVLEFAWIDGA